MTLYQRISPYLTLPYLTLPYLTLPRHARRPLASACSSATQWLEQLLTERSAALRLAGCERLCTTGSVPTIRCEST